METNMVKKDQVIWSNQDGTTGLDFEQGFTALVNGAGPVAFVPIDSSRCGRKDGTQVRGVVPQKLGMKTTGSSKEEVAANKQSRKVWTGISYGAAVELVTE